VKRAAHGLPERRWTALEPRILDMLDRLRRRHQLLARQPLAPVGYAPTGAATEQALLRAEIWSQKRGTPLRCRRCSATGIG